MDRRGVVRKDRGRGVRKGGERQRAKQKSGEMRGKEGV